MHIPPWLAGAESLEFHQVVAGDGTKLRAWTNDPAQSPDAPTVVLCNGLGTNPWAWPALLRPGCGVRVVSWNHRGTGGSQRPADPARVRMTEHVADAVSVMDHFGVERSVLMGWSIGVNVMFELALAYPERVAGLFAVAGVPGDTFAAMLAPMRVPPAIARRTVAGLAYALMTAGGALTPLTTHLPIGRKMISVIDHSGFMINVADKDMAAKAVREFLDTPVDWYFHQALAVGEHRRVSLRGIHTPVELVAGTWDIMAGAKYMASAAAQLSNATYTELPGSHFLPLEKPDDIHRLLRDFLTRVASR